MEDSVAALNGLDCAAIRAELRRILGSQAFADSPRASSFLAYIVEETLQNRSRNLKEYTVGVEVFERGDSFDPRVDTIVRVEASRLRSRLKRYYESEGVEDEIRIELPRGRYAPAFVARSPVRHVDRRPTRKRLWLCIAGTSIATAITVILLHYFATRPALPRQRGVVVLPFLNVGEDTAGQALCDGLMETLTNRLGELEDTQQSFWVVAATDVRESGVRSAGKALRTFGATLALTGSVQRAANIIRVTINLVDTTTARQLGSRRVQLNASAYYALTDEIERQAADLLAMPTRPPTSPASKREPSSEDYYLQGVGYLQRGPDNAEIAAELFQRALAKDPHYALAFIGLAQASLELYDATHDPTHLDSAAVDATKAASLGGAPSAVQVILGRLHYARGEYPEAIRDFRETLARGPRNDGAQEQLALALEAIGHPDEAEDVLQHAIEVRPGYWGGYYALGVLLPTPRRQR
jgi:TolB-like protein/Tfp pilus assembly protein PilF